MHRDSGQFQSFDGLDNRRELMILMERLGNGLPKPLADERRAKFLQSLLPQSSGVLKKAPMKVQPCDPVAAYNLLVAITGVLEVDINVAARKLERIVGRQ